MQNQGEQNNKLPYFDIFKKLDGRSLAQSGRVCKTWRDATNNQQLWHSCFVEDWCPREMNGEVQSVYDANTNYHKLYENWALGCPQEVFLYEKQKHSGTVRGIKYIEGKCYSVAEDGCLRISDIEIGSSIQHICCDIGEERRIAFQCMLSCPQSPSTVVVGCSDGAVRAWDCRVASDEPVFQIARAHYDEVFALDTSAKMNDLIYSGGGDHEIYSWDMRNLKSGFVQQFSGHDGSVFAILVDSDRGVLYGAGGDGRINRFNIQDGSWLSIMSGHHGDVVGLSLGEERLISGGDDGSIKEWQTYDALSSPEEQEPIATLGMRHVVGKHGSEVTAKTSVTCVTALGRAPNGVLVGTWLGQIAISQRMGQLKPMGKGRERAGGKGQYVPVTCVHAKERLILSGFDDGVVRVVRMV
eukprot:TRINITY_DN10440_c0_g1_i1.p1 TRINITY_DN10440_c0_g1~~TRINITY_DN10440_c0_g1_i1.p1  ORF type:complete len:412 (-),score=48.07 TRINITY_DN10440_c0_g1_i1:495-1730(-)